MFNVDVGNDFYVRKGMELEKQREKQLDFYAKSRNPKVLQKVNALTEECNAIWKTLKLKEMNRLGFADWKAKQKN